MESAVHPGSGIFLTADHTGVKKVEFCFSHGTFQADEETVIKVGHVVDTVFVDHEGAEQAAQLKELHKVG